jgi:hypothetical protein
MKGGGSEWEGGYEGPRTFRRGTFGFWGGMENYRILGDCIGAFFQGRDWKTVFLVLDLRNLLHCYRGASVVGSFGLRGKESLRNPGAREPDRLLLAG